MAYDKELTTPSYDVYTGTRDPSYPIKIGWRMYESYMDKKEAIREAKRLIKNGVLVQVTRSTIIFHSPNIEFVNSH